jgi:hypothetical protein
LIGDGQAVIALAVGTAVVLATVVWPVKKVAEWVYADYPTYGRSVAAVLLVLLTTLLLLLLAASLLPWPGLALLLALPAAGGIYAGILGTSFPRGLVVALVSGLIGALVQLGVLTLMGLVSFGLAPGIDGGGEELTLEQAADRVCACGGREDCVQEHSAGLLIVAMKQAGRMSDAEIQAQMDRAQACIQAAGGESAEAQPRTAMAPSRSRGAEAGSSLAGLEARPGLSIRRSGGNGSTSIPAVPGSLSDVDAEESSQAEPGIEIALQPSTAAATNRDRGKAPENGGAKTSAAPSKEPPRALVVVGIEAIGEHLGERARVTLAESGQVLEGVLIAPTMDYVVSLRRSVYGGYFSMHIPAERVQRIEVEPGSKGRQPISW